VMAGVISCITRRTPWPRLRSSCAREDGGPELGGESKSDCQTGSTRVANRGGCGERLRRGPRGESGGWTALNSLGLTCCRPPEPGCTFPRDRGGRPSWCSTTSTSFTGTMLPKRIPWPSRTLQIGCAGTVRSPRRGRPMTLACPVPSAVNCSACSPRSVTT
jgi:hypothetical protein